MANLKSKKEVWMNALRQTKEYRLSDQGGEYTVPCKGADPSEYDGDVYPEDSKDKRNAYHKQHIERDYIEEAKIEIINKVSNHFQDMLFEMICEEMGNRCVFQSQNYLTAEGHELFEEEFFDFYHEHHGEIMFEVMKNITN
jgi:hypothetical protein